MAVILSLQQTNLSVFTQEEVIMKKISALLFVSIIFLSFNFAYAEQKCVWEAKSKWTSNLTECNNLCDDYNLYRNCTGDYLSNGLFACGYDQKFCMNVIPGALYRYYHPGTGDHFYTTNSNEVELSSKEYGTYRYEGHAGYVETSPTTGTVPLYRYFNTKNSDHFYTTNWSELGNGNGTNYTFEGIQCYVYTSKVGGTAPFYRYYNTSNGDHFYTTNWNELRDGSGTSYTYEGVQCYISTNP